MAIGTYGDLKLAVKDWLDNDTLVNKTDDFILLAEARFNRILRDPQMEAR